MQRPGAATRAGRFYLRQDVGAAFRFDLIGCFAHERVAAKARDLGIDCVVDVLDGGLDACRIVRIKPCLDEFVLQSFEAFAGCVEGAGRFVGEVRQCVFSICDKGQYQT